MKTNRRNNLWNCVVLFVTVLISIALLPGAANAAKNLTIDMTGNGTVSCTGGKTTTNTDATWSYANNAVVTCDLTPAAGYTLTTPATSPATVTMTTAKTLAVTFTVIPPVTKTLSVNITGTGSVACQKLPSGTVTTLNSSGTITYNSTDTASCVLTPGVNYALTTPASSPATRAMSSNQTLDVLFSSTLITNVTVSGTVAPAGGGSIRADSAAGPLIVAQGSASGSNATITANAAHTFYLIPAAGNGIAKLVYDSVDVTSSLSCPGGIDATCTYDAPTVGTSSHSISATFDTVFTLTGTASTTGCSAVAGGGTISPASQKVARGKTATFYTVPTVGYALKQVNYNGSADMATAQYAPYTYSKANIQANGAVEAVFTPVYTITSSWSGSGGATGGVSPGSATVICNGDSPPFIITPTVPAVISNVLAGGVSQGVVNSYTFTNVSANSTLSAIFEISTSQSNNYTITPPFIHTNVLPNLLLMLDNSASMYDLANDPYGKCYDDAYNNAAGADYAGYFESGSFYSYSANKFIPGAAMPASCTFRTADFCVNMTVGAKGVRTVSQFIAKGKFLNWLSVSKLDQQKKILTGGKYDTGNQVLVGESRGCMGRRFVKMVSNTQASGSSEDLSTMTFSVRGPVSTDADYVNPASQGGTTRIEIYDGTYNLGSCQAAIDEWTDLAQMGQAQNATTACLDCPTCDATRTLQMKSYVYMTHLCWHSLNGSNIPGGQKSKITDACQSVYLLPQYSAGTPPSSLIVNDSAGDSVCSSVIQHPIMTSGGNDLGYMGLCWNGTSWNDACFERELADFCGQMNSNNVTDPSGTIAGTTESNTVPAFVIDAGVNALGKVTGTYFVNVSRATSIPPTGLIDEFKTYINFGAMGFNLDGSGSECVDSDFTGTKIVCARHCSNNSSKACYKDTDCSPGSCDLNPKTDGGKILDNGYIGYNAVGDHSSGLIKSIDDITAGSWTPFAESFYNAIGYFSNRAAIRLQTADFDATKPPPNDTCLKNNILLISDGGSTADRNASVSALAGSYNDGTANSHGTCPNSEGSKDLVAMAWLAKNRNIKNFNLSGGSPDDPAKNNNDSITSYVVYSGPTTASTDPCVPQNIMKNAAIAGGTSHYQANSYETLRQGLIDAFQKIASSSASGTAASILSNSEGSGAVILQAVFYPKKDFLSSTNIKTSTTWIGEMQNLWYYVDPFIGNSTVREDTGYTSGNHEMNLVSDYVTKFFFDASANETKAQLKIDADGNGTGDTVLTNAVDSRVKVDAPGVVSADDVSSIWRAGRLLWKRNLATSNRKLYTYLKGTTVKRSNGTETGAFSVDGLIDLVADFDGLSAANKEIITIMLQAADADDAKNIIKYAAGDDTAVIDGITTNRNRTVTISEKNPSTGVVTTSTNVWKLGDIISSTPRVQSGGKLNNYHLDPAAGYGDTTYANDSANSGFTNSAAYKARGMVYAGANDGMMHAFKLGNLVVKSEGATKAQLTGANLGEEQWAFIPRHVLPYLKYLADESYNHLYLVDGTTRIVDASIGYNDGSPTEYTGCSADAYWNCKRDGTTTANKSWRTVLIGSMGIGGASRNKTDTCVDKVSVGTCVKTPIEGIGYSSYFALDITDPGPPQFLWDFSDESLGYSTTGAAVARVGYTITNAGVTYKDTNGRWYAVIGNGPSGPINTTTHEFRGNSDKKLKTFVLDLKYGPKAGYKFEHESTLVNAFAGSLADAPIDTNRWNRTSAGFYSDDALYFGYAQCTANCTTADPTWNGGVARLLTHENPDPSTWELTSLISNTGPVTSSIGRLQDRRNHNLWIYFGAGRYYFKDDDKATGRTIIGVKDPCYKGNDAISAPVGDACRTIIDFSGGTGFINQTSTIATTVGDKGWYIQLADENLTTKNYAERSITDPVAMTNGAVFFTTYKPAADVCKFGGNSYMWGVKYDTGGVAPATSLKGKALVQVSTGSFEEVDLATALTAEGGRKMAEPMVGKPPNDPPPIVSSSGNKPLKRVIHMQVK